MDGGRNWQTAELHGPVLDKCAHALYSCPLNWNGEELLVQSRAIDETGYVQPTIQAWQSVRG